ncbi:30S ribosomal protein S21 domain protein [Ostertagia ostertagi]
MRFYKHHEIAAKHAGIFSSSREWCDRRWKLELPSDYPVDYILRVLKERVGFLEGLKMYYTSASSIRGKEDLNAIRIEFGDKKSLGSLSNGRGVLNFVIAKPGVYVFKNE